MGKTRPWTVDGRLLYLSADTAARRRQLSARQVHRAEPATLGLGTGVRVLPDELKAAVALQRHTTQPNRNYTISPQ